jgi:hypothetical protein
MINTILNYLDALNKYSNLLIATLTIVIVYFTYRSVRSSQITLQLNALPIFFPKITTSGKRSVLVLENCSNYPAYDIDIWVMGQYYEDEVSYISLLDEKYINKIKIDFKKSLYSHDVKFYSIIDHILHYAFPPKSKCEIDLDFNLPPETFHLILQFKDSVGHNYLLQSWLHGDYSIGEKRKDFTFGNFKSNFKPTKRIEYGACVTFNELYDKLTNLFVVIRYMSLFMRILHIFSLFFDGVRDKIYSHVYLEKEVKDSLLRAFPSGYQHHEDYLLSIEGRGVFKSN